MKKIEKIIFIFLFFFCVIFLNFLIFFWLKIKKFEPIFYYHLPPQKTFLKDFKTESLFDFPLKKIVEKELKKLKEEKKSFIFANLKKMELSLYKEGEKFLVLPIQAKGQDWFWGKTPPGIYSLQFKAKLLFSSPAQAWMPYALQFFGNYFIHGWPYDKSGRTLPPSQTSGGCIRLKTADAKILFDFAKTGMPILIFDQEDLPLLPSLSPLKIKIKPPQTKAENIFIADLNTGEILLNKKGDSQIWAGLFTNLMLALTASNSINLEKRIKIKEWMFEKVKEGILIPGKSYQGFELLKLLLSQNSIEAALALAYFFDPEIFVKQMNFQAQALGLGDTFFENVLFLSKENVTSLWDVAKVFHYLKNYRSFILKISPQIRGSESFFGLFKMKAMNFDRDIFVGIANSPQIEKDLEKIFEWLEKNFSLVKL